MNRQPVRFQFSPPKSGWLTIIVTMQGDAIPIHTSNVFDPYPAFLNWLEQCAKAALPTIWSINEEDTFMEFSAYMNAAGVPHLKLVGNRRDDEAWDDEAVYTFFDEPVDLTGLVQMACANFRQMLDSDYDPQEWGPSLEALNWERLELYLI